MARPIFDTATLWARLTADQQLAIGVAAIDREIVIHGRDEIDGPNRGDFDALDDQAEDTILSAVLAAIDLAAIEADQYPLPSFAGVQPSSN